MLYGAEITVCSEINTKHINTVWAEIQFLSFKPVGAPNQQALKGYCFLRYEAVWFGEWFLKFRMYIIPSSSGTNKSLGHIFRPLGP
jgi:hypothetical protein